MSTTSQPRPSDLLIHEQHDLLILEADGGDGVFNPDGTVNMVLIRPCNGRGPYNNIYEADVLERDAAHFKGWSMFDNHDSPIARRARAGLPRAPSELAGVVRESWWDPSLTTPEDDKYGFGQGAVVGKCALTDAMEALVRKIPEAIKGSLNAQATNKRLGERNGARGWIVEGFVNDPENSSFDLVTKAGAGGRVRSVLEALYADGNEPAGSTTDPEGGPDSMTDILEALRSDEAVELLSGMITNGVKAALAEERQSIQESVRDEFAAANRHRSLAGEARRIIENAKGVPTSAKTRLIAEYGVEEQDDSTVTVGRGLAAIEAVTDTDGTVTKPAKTVLAERLDEEFGAVRDMIREAAPTVPRAPGAGAVESAGRRAEFGGQSSPWAQTLRRRGLNPEQFGASKPATATTTE